MSGICSQMWVGGISYIKESQWVVLLVSSFQWMLSASPLSLALVSAQWNHFSFCLTECRPFCLLYRWSSGFIFRFNYLLWTFLFLQHNIRDGHNIMNLCAILLNSSPASNTTTFVDNVPKYNTNNLNKYQILNNFVCSCETDKQVSHDVVNHYILRPNFTSGLISNFTGQYSPEHQFKKILRGFKPHEPLVPNFEDLKTGLVRSFTHYIWRCCE